MGDNFSGALRLMELDLYALSIGSGYVAAVLIVMLGAQDNVLDGDMENFVSRFVYTAELAIALSLGIVIVASLFKYKKRFKKA